VTPNTLVTFCLAAVAAGGVAYVFLDPLLSGEARARKRQKALVGAGAGRRADRVLNPGANRREQVAQTLKELDTRGKARRVTIEQRLAYAGLEWSKARFLVASAILAAVLGLMMFTVTGNPIIAGSAVVVGGLGVPRWVLGFMKKRRTDRFVEELPNALDVIVRGIRSGLPIGDCIRVIAMEAREPVKTEFRTIIESQALGITIAEAVAKLHDRMPVPEASFFAIVIAIQQKGGGNLSEALGNVSKVLRERRKMKGKISAMSMEAKASAVIIAALPFIVALLTYLSSPAYIELLWTTNSGKVALAASGFWMLMGIGVMKKMISFEI
jgi:tight adherence protein B